MGTAASRPGPCHVRCNDERLALVGICQFREFRGALASLYASAFASDPSLADDLSVGRRYSAARSAAVAGCGGGADGATSSEAQREYWRRQARDWLRADLAAWRGRLADDGAPDRAEVQQQLTRWRNEPNLAGLRDRAELARLPADERQECLSLWNEADGLLEPSRRAAGVP